MASGYVNAGNLGIPIATYALGNAAEVAPVMLFQLTVLAPLFSTVLDLTSARADGERPPLLRTLTAPLRNPIALASAAGLLVSATGPLGARARAGANGVRRRARSGCRTSRVTAAPCTARAAARLDV